MRRPSIFGGNWAGAALRLARKLQPCSIQRVEVFAAEGRINPCNKSDERMRMWIRGGLALNLLFSTESKLAMKHTVLLIDANSMEADSLERAVRGEAIEFVRALDPREARDFMDQTVRLVICDLRAGRDASFDLLRDWGGRSDSPDFIFLVEAGDVQSAVDGMKLGAADCLIKPIDTQKLRELTSRMLRSGANGREQLAPSSHGDEPNSGTGNGAHGLEIPGGTSLEELERAAVQQALEQHSGNRTHAARELGISVRTLQRKLKAWRMPILVLHHYSPRPSSVSSSNDR
jgi:DNA-binding NtrC family response regulator